MGVVLVVATSGVRGRGELDEATDDEAVAALEAYVRSLPLPLPVKTHLEHVAGMGVGVVADVAIGRGEAYFALPLAATVSTATIEDSVLGPVIQRLYARAAVDAGSARVPGFANHPSAQAVSSDAAFVVWLASVRFGSDALRAALGRGHTVFVDSLPAYYGTPLYFTPTELAALAGTELGAAVAHDKARVSAMAAWLRSVLGPGVPAAALTDDAVTWAWSVVASRRINVGGAPASSRGAAHLLPYIDMLNAKESSDRTFTSYSAKLNAVTMYADDDYAPGDQVFETYGNKSNAGYLRFNGFVYVDNPAGCADVTLATASIAPGAADPAFDPHRARLSLVLRGPNAVFARCIGGGAGQTADFEAVALLSAAAAARGVGAAAASLSPTAALAPQLTPAERAAAYATASALLADKLAAYPSSLRADLAALADADAGLSDNMRAAIQYRVAEKSILLRLRRRLRRSWATRDEL